MRILFGFLLAATLLAGEAEASSFVVLEPLNARLGPSMMALGATPSIQTLGATTPDARQTLSYPYPGDTAPAFQPPAVQISPSIIAMGEPPVEMANVAAIDRDSGRHDPRSLPVVIRGGVEGDAFTRAAPPTGVPVATEAPQQASTAPSGTPKPPARAPEPDPAAPPPAPTPPSPPTREPR
ncbi:MAG: hypothetical protein KF723_02430 [Rhizobiaceae bacterium]|nr:hypothetical protein [Rhizobiaceae bacterium]